MLYCFLVAILVAKLCFPYYILTHFCSCVLSARKEFSREAEWRTTERLRDGGSVCTTAGLFDHSQDLFFDTIHAYKDLHMVDSRDKRMYTHPFLVWV